MWDKLSMIKLLNVEKKFLLGNEEITILHKVSLEIKKQEYVSILGPSGSGKSTLMYIIGLLDLPSSGDVIIQDKDTAKMNDDEISRLRNKFIGFVFQQFNLINKLTVLENILLPTIYYNEKLNFNPSDRANELMKRFGIDHRAGSYPNKISGGEQQRASIARSLILDPDVILADEPTGNLDSKNGNIILDLIDELNKKDKKTVIVVTHEKEVSDRTHRKIVIHDGEITYIKNERLLKNK